MGSEFTRADGETVHVPTELLGLLYEELWRASAPGGISGAAKVRYAAIGASAAWRA
jgi:hypothetical protein